MKYLTIIFLIIFNFIVNAQWTNSTTDNTSIIIVPETVSLMDGVCNSVSDGSGGVIIVWSATRPGPSGKDIYAQRLDTSGTRLWGDGGVVICNATADQINPVLISDGAGGAIIAWEDARDYALTGLNIYAQRVDGNGSIQWFTNGTVVCANGLDQMNPVICSDSSSFQGAYIAWVDWRNGLDPNIYAQRILGNGNVQWLSNGNPICEAPRPQNSVSIITADAQGNAIISWIDYRNATPYSPQIYSQKVNRNGFGQWANNGIQISANTDVYLGFSSVIPDYAGGAIFSWDSYGSSGTTGLDIYAQRVSGIGNVLWNPLGIKVCESSGNQYFPNLVGDGKGGAIITWSDERSSPGTSIYAQRINAFGAKFWATDGELICSDTYSDYDDIRIVPTSSGGAIICWSDQRNINISQLDIYAQRIDPNGNSLWTPSGTVISNNIAQQVYPEIINDGSDNAIIIWPDGRQSVYAQRILKEGSFVYRHVIDGFILNDEYGSHIEGENQKTSDSKTWYMDWTEDSLFIGVAAFDDPNDALIFYLDTKVQIPVNLDNNSNGNLLGDDHLGAIQPQLPFTSDFYLYYSPTYGRYFLKPDGVGNWDWVNRGISFNYIYNYSNQVIELAVAWSDINPNFQFYGGEFNWLGAICNINSGGNQAGSYARVPLQNPDGSFPEFSWYYTVRFTAGLGNPVFPFANESYTHKGTSLTIDQLDCFDFTMNTPNMTINRSSGVWNIDGRMVIADGTVNFLNTANINIKENYVQSGGNVNFSNGFNNADVFVGLNCLKYGGIINVNPGQTFTLNGSSNGILQGPFPFQNLTINKSQLSGSRNVNAWSDQTVNGILTLQQGNLIMKGPPPNYTQYTLIIGPNGSVGGGGFIQGGMTVFLPPSPAPNGGDSPDNLLVNFPVGTANGPSPVSIDFSSVISGGTLTIEAIQNVHPNTIDSSETLGRYWKITKDNNLAFTSADITFNYRPEDFNGTTFSEAIDEASMIVGKYDASWSYPSIFTRTPGGINDGGSITISGVTSFSDFTMFKAQLSANIRVFLEGPFSAGSMSTSLNTGGSIPLNQPYNTTPWNYNGTETVGSIPTGVVDWVLLELRSNTTTTVARRAAFLRSNGSLVDLDGTSNVSFPGVQAGNYYLVVYHRNHLPIMTANPVQVSNNPTLFDLSTGQGQAFGTNAMKNLGGGVYGLYTADTDGSGTVNASDRSNTWNQRNLSGYYGTDVDLSGTVNAADRSAVWNNRNISTQVPAPVNKPVTEIVKEE